MNQVLYALKDGTLFIAVTAVEQKRAFDAGYLPVCAMSPARATQHLATVLNRFAICVDGAWHLKASLDGPMQVDGFFYLSREIRAFVEALP